MKKEVTATLEKDLGRAIRAGHPWVYRDAIRDLSVEPGTVVTVRDREGRFVGRGVAERGPIAVRIWTTTDEAIDAHFVRRRVRAALSLRERTTPPDTDAVRLLHGEGDRLGGVVVDRYADYLVFRADGDGALAFEKALVDALVDALRPRGILAKRGRRGETVREVIFGEVPKEPVEIVEHGMRLVVDLHRGQKTGLFLDHRQSRRTAKQIAEGMRVLNLYGYTGGFSVAAGLGGARHVTTVDVAEGALAFATRSWADNGLAPNLHETHAMDVVAYLEEAEKARRSFDFIVADPPSFAPNQKAKPAAMKAYRALHRSCLRRLSDGGYYLAASCSSHVGRDAFEETLLDAAEKNGTVLQVLGRWGAATDHPRLLAFPEGDYLAVILARIVG